MLRSSEIKPLFVDLSLCDKSFSFFYYVKGVSLYDQSTFFFLFSFFSFFFPLLSNLIV